MVALVDLVGEVGAAEVLRAAAPFLRARARRAPAGWVVEVALAEHRTAAGLDGGDVRGPVRPPSAGAAGRARRRRPRRRRQARPRRPRAMYNAYAFSSWVFVQLADRPEQYGSGSGRGHEGTPKKAPKVVMMARRRLAMRVMTELARTPRRLRASRTSRSTWTAGASCAEPRRSSSGRRSSRPSPTSSTTHNRLVAKDELIKALWTDSFVTDDSLVQCLVELRRALGDEGQACIKTVPRRGYIFTAERPGPDACAGRAAARRGRPRPGVSPAPRAANGPWPWPSWPWRRPPSRTSSRAGRPRGRRRSRTRTASSSPTSTTPPGTRCSTARSGRPWPSSSGRARS